MFFSGMRPLRFRAIANRSGWSDRSLLLRIGLLRTVVATCLGLGMAVVLLGDEHDTKDPLPWEKAFQVVSASNKKESLVIILITNEDPFRERSDLLFADCDRRNVAVECLPRLAAR